MGQHINTFAGGMNSDVNILYQPDGTYRYMKNCELVSQDGNNYAVRDCHGNVQLFNINTPFATAENVPPFTATRQIAPMVIGMISFPNRLIVFSTNAESVDTDGNPIPGYGEVGEIEYTNYGQGIQPKLRFGSDNQGYRPLYHHKDLNFTKLHQIEGFAYYENDDAQRVYWTDNLNEPRVFNVGDPIFTTYIGSSSLVTGKQYMVVEGIVLHNSVYYGPGLPSGNIFTAASATYTDPLSPSPTALVIEYYPLELLAFNPSRSLGTIKFKEYGTGNVLCGSKIYFYRLYDTTGNIATSWSYGCSPIHVGTTNSVSSVPSNPYFDFVGGGSSTATLNSGNSVFITIDNIDQNYTRIQVACAEYDQLTDIPRIISVIADLSITSSSMDIEHTGNTNLGGLTTSDITLFPASIITCKTITTNKNYILIGNIKEREEFEIDLSTVSFSEIERKFPVHTTDITSCTNVLSYINPMVSADLAANPSSVIEYTTWLVTDDSGGDITYNAVNYSVGQVISAVPGVSAITIPAGSQIRPCVAKQKYVTTGGDIVWDAIQLTKGYWSFKDPAVAHHVKGYWSGETYRFGILFYDLKGNPFFVKWLTDFQFENLRTSEISETNDYYSLKSKAVRINGIRIPADIVPKIKGFSVVRADRDQSIISQGLLWQTVRMAGFSPASCQNAGWALPTADYYSSGGKNEGSNYAYYSLICPDRLVDNPMVDFLAAKELKEAAWLQAVDFNGGVGTPAYAKSIDLEQQVESRFITQLADDGALNEVDINAIADIVEDQAVTSFGSQGLIYTNRSHLSNAIVGSTAGNINNDCTTGSDNYIADSRATGGARVVVETKNGMSYFGRSTSYGQVDYAVAGPVGPHKLLVNLTNKKTVFYGGSSDSAKATTLYISVGHFQPITDAVIADTCNTGNPLNYNFLAFNGIDIFGGDCFTCLVDYGHSLANQTLTGALPADNHSIGIKFPCQCNANYDLRRGRTTANNRMHGQPTGVVYNFGGVARLEGFSYNKGYSSEGIQFAYPAMPIDAFFEQKFLTRIRFAGEKIINEYIDSFRNFLINDYKDLPGTYGEINNLKTKDDRTFVWQNHAVSSVPILERQVVATGGGEPTTLGTGGVVDRYDLLSSYYGNQHQWSVVLTEYGFAWFDMRRKAFMLLDSGLVEMSAVAGMKSFFNEAFLEVLGNTSPTTNLMNDPLSQLSQDRPLIGNGITGVYDPKLKYTYLTFKFKSRQLVSGENYSYINKDFTIAVYHPDKTFVGFFDWTPAIAHNHHQTLFSANNPKSKTKYYGPTMPPTTFDVGNVVPYLNEEFVCISPVTITAYPGIPTQRPNFPGSTFWYKTNNTSELWVHNQPKNWPEAPAPDYEYSKFFGLVVDNEIHFVINPKTQNPFNVLNMEQKGNSENVTDVYTYADNGQQASDVNIKSHSRYYTWIYDRIASSMPLQSNGSRITDSYLKVVLRKKNWDVLPYARSRGVKILQFVKSFFQEKR